MSPIRGYVFDAYGSPAEGKTKGGSPNASRPETASDSRSSQRLPESFFRFT